MKMTHETMTSYCVICGQKGQWDVCPECATHRVRIVNLTPHAVTVQRPDGSRETYPPIGPPARVATLPSTTRESVEGVPVQSPVEFGEVADLPEPREGVVYLVSIVVGARVQRADVFVPATGPNDGVIRENGQVVAVTRLTATV